MNAGGCYDGRRRGWEVRAYRISVDRLSGRTLCTAANTTSAANIVARYHGEVALQEHERSLLEALVAHLATQAGVEPKAAKAVLAALETAILGSVHKKGSGEFTLPGLLKIGLQQVPAKKKRFGKDPFTGEERWFPAKPASVKIKTRALKKLKDATL